MGTLDLVAFCVVAQIINVESEVACPLRDYVNEEGKNLVGHYNRMKDQAWGDHWDEATGETMDLNPHIPKPEPPVEEEKKEEAADDNKKEEDKEKGDKDEKETEEKKEEFFAFSFEITRIYIIDLFIVCSFHCSCF